MKKILTLLFIVTLCSCEPIATKYNTLEEQEYATTIQLEKVAKSDTLKSQYKKVVELDDVVYVFNQNNKLVMKVNTQIDSKTNFFIALGAFVSLILVILFVFHLLNKIFE